MQKLGKVEWVPAVPGNYKVQNWASDGELGFSHGFTLPVTTANHPPRIYGIPYDPIFEGHEWRYQLLAHDPDGDPLTWKIEDKRPTAQKEGLGFPIARMVVLL